MRNIEERKYKSIKEYRRTSSSYPTESCLVLVADPTYAADVGGCLQSDRLIWDYLGIWSTTTFIATSNHGSQLCSMEHPLTNRESERWGKFRWSGVTDIRCMGLEMLPFASRRKMGGGTKGLLKNSVCAQSCSIADANQHHLYARLIMGNPQLMIHHLSPTCIPGELCLHWWARFYSRLFPLGRL